MIIAISVVYVIALVIGMGLAYRRGKRNQFREIFGQSLCACGHGFQYHTGDACKVVIKVLATTYGDRKTVYCGCTTFVGTPPINAIGKKAFQELVGRYDGIYKGLK